MGGVAPDSKVPRDLAHLRSVLAEQCTGRSPDGVVAAAAPLAAALGADCLRSGGNVFDAVTVAALAETVLLPPKCGFGGDLIALVLRAGRREPEALVAVGGAPAGLAEVAATGRMGVVGANSVGVPAAAAGYAALSELGNFDREHHARPAAQLAFGGFAWAKVCTELAEQARELIIEENPHGTRYLPAGSPIAAGAVTRLPGLAEVLREWVQRGAQLMRGPVGEAVVDAVHSRNGVLRMEDMVYSSAVWGPCEHKRIAGHDVWATPAPTHGSVLLDALASVAEPAEAGPADLYRAVSEAVGRYRGASGETLGDGGTSIVSGADEEGNLAVVVHSNSFPRFGSGIVVEDFDLILANRAGRGFSTTPGSANFPEAGRQPGTTLHAWSVARGGGVHAVGGTPGGINQVPWNTQLVAELIRSARWPGESVISPRWEALAGGGIRVEGGFDPGDVERIEQVESHVERAPMLGLRSAQQVVVRPEAGEAFVASADPRTVGAVVPV